MVTDGEWSAESGTRLAVEHLAVGEEQTGFSCETVRDTAGLAYEAMLQFGAITDD